MKAAESLITLMLPTRIYIMEVLNMITTNLSNTPTTKNLLAALGESSTYAGSESLSKRLVLRSAIYEAAV